MTGWGGGAWSKRVWRLAPLRFYLLIHGTSASLFKSFDLLLKCTTRYQPVGTSPLQWWHHTHTQITKTEQTFDINFNSDCPFFSGKWSSIYCTMPFDLVRPRTITERWQPARERDVTQLQHCNVYLLFHSKSHAFIAENGLSTSAWQGWGT